MWCKRVVLLAVLGLGACGPGPEDGELGFTGEEDVASSEAGLMGDPKQVPSPLPPPPPPPQPLAPYATQVDPECGEDCPGLPQDPIPLTILRPTIQPRIQVLVPTP
jgi:hypothetical protein